MSEFDDYADDENYDDSVKLPQLLSFYLNCITLKTYLKNSFNINTVLVEVNTTFATRDRS